MVAETMRNAKGRFIKMYSDKALKEHRKAYNDKYYRDIRNMSECMNISFHAIRRYGLAKILVLLVNCNYKCSICHSNCKLRIHHIDFSGQTDNPNDTLENLLPICEVCHGKIHGYEYWKGEAKKRGRYKYKGREREYARESAAEYRKKNRELLAKKQREYIKRKKNNETK